MSFSGRTPESLLPRSDSKNPATTCRGLTTNGRPCRRALASPKASPTPSPIRKSGQSVVSDPESLADLYCWQHQDQVVVTSPSHTTSTIENALKNKTSIDTLIQKIGVLELDDSSRYRQRKHRQKSHSGQLNVASGNKPIPQRSKPSEPISPRQPEKVRYTSGRSNVKASWSCCIRVDDDDLPPPRQHQSRSNVEYSEKSRIRQTEHDFSSSNRHHSDSEPWGNASQQNTIRSSPQTTQSQTRTLLSLIPSTASPQTTSQLLTELSRPLSSADEDGYIYIFWLTPENEVCRPDDETASTLLDDSDASPRTTISADATLHRYASTRHPQSKSTSNPPKTITLKIGRASNVHRRLNQWSKQCSQNISLIRFYPYHPSSSPSSASHSRTTSTQSTQPKKVPHVHRVERLIHIELSGSGKRVTDAPPCETCGREHREWFEVEATRKGLREVDEVVKRWVRWAEMQ